MSQDEWGEREIPDQTFFPDAYIKDGIFHFKLSMYASEHDIADEVYDVLFDADGEPRYGDVSEAYYELEHWSVDVPFALDLRSGDMATGLLTVS